MTEQQKNAADLVNEAMSARGVDMLPCEVCGTKDSFQLVDGYHIAFIVPTSKHTVIGGRNMPLLPICCMKCGNTKFLNSLILQVGEDIFKKQDGQAQP